MNICIFDDNAGFRKGLKALLQSIKGFEVVGEAATSLEALEVAREHQPDIRP